MRVVFDMKPLYDMLDDTKRRQIPYAHTLALTNTAMYARRAALLAFRQAFDRPKPSTLSEKSGPLRVKTASLSKYPDDYSEVKVKDIPQAKGDAALVYLSHHIRGGTRVAKKTEVLMKAAGALRAGEFMIPGEAAQLDAYGNIKAQQIQDILSSLGTQSDALKHTKGKTLKAAYRKISSRKKRAADYFVVRKGNARSAHLAEGVWQRYGGTKIRPVLIFVSKAPRYRKRIRWEQLALDVGRMRFPLEFHIAFKKALATMKVRPNSIRT